MEVIEIRLETLAEHTFHEPIALAMGNFDGVHHGHQKVIQICVNQAKEKQLIPCVLTFFPHPSRVILSKKKAQLLYPKARKYKLMAELGVERVYELRFEQALAALKPQDFIDKILKQLNAKHVVAGFDFCFVQKGEGHFTDIEQYQLGDIGYTIVTEEQYMHKKVSSTRIRECILSGEFVLAMELLGRPFSSYSIVVTGDQRGRILGFPTANLVIPSHFVVPSPGVYVVYASVKGRYYRGVCNIGFRPTFYKCQEEPLIEVHLFHFQQDIYGEEMEVFWIARIRDEMKFTQIDDLKKQIELDKQYAAEFFTKKNHVLLDFFQ